MIIFNTCLLINHNQHTNFPFESVKQRIKYQKLEFFTKNNFIRRQIRRKTLKFSRFSLDFKLRKAWRDLVPNLQLKQKLIDAKNQHQPQQLKNHHAIFNQVGLFNDILCKLL